MDIYSDDIQAVIEESITVLDIGKDLKNSEDLESDLMGYIQAIEAIDDWGDNELLCNVYDLLRLIQQELIFGRPIVEFQSCNSNAVVAFANLLFTPGMTISKNIPRAHELLQEVLAVNPTYEYALASLASLVLDGAEGLARDPVRAFELFSQVLCTRPDYPFALTNIGELYRFGDVGIEQDEKAAYHYFQRALDADPENLRALQSLAVLLKYGFDTCPANPKKAYDYFSKITELDPYNTYALASLADLVINDYEGVEADCKRGYELLQEALAISPNYLMALGLCGDLLRYGGDNVPADRAKARQMLEHATKLDPTYGIAFASLGELYMRDEEPDYEKAYSCFEKAYNLGHRSAFCLNHLADLLVMKFEYDRACELAMASLEQIPNQHYPLWLLGCAMQYKGDIASAALSRSYFEKALECDPYHYSTLMCLGHILAKSDMKTQKERARELFYRAFEISPNNPDLLHTLAELCYFDEDYRDTARALAYLRESISLDDEDARTHALLAYIILDQKMEEAYKEAYNHLERALALDPDNTSAGYNLCYTLIYGIADMPPNLERARLLIERFLTNFPNDDEFLELQTKLIEQLLEQKQTTLQKAKHFFKNLLTAG